MKISIKHFLIFITFVFATDKVQSQNLDMYFVEGKYEEVIQQLTEKEKYSSLTISEYILLSKSYQKTNRKYQSLQIANKVISQLEGVENTHRLSVAYNLKAENLIDLVKVKEGIDFCDKVLVVLLEKQAPFFQELCIKCGILFDQGGQHQKAFDLYSQIEKKELKSLAIYVNNYGIISMNLKKYKEALKYIKEGIEISYRTNQLASVNVNYTNLAKIQIAQKKWDKAKGNLDAASKALQESSQVHHKKEWLNTYYQYFRLQNKLNESKAVLAEIKAYNNLIYDAKIQQKTKELSAINERKNILNKRFSKIDQQIKVTDRTKLIWFVILICVIIVILSRSLYLIYKNAELKYNGVLNQQELLSSQMTPHFIFNSLSILQGMVLNNEQEKATGYLLKFSNIVNFIVRKQSHKFIPISEEINSLKDYVDLQNLSALKEINYLTSIEDAVADQMAIPPMLLQPFIENSIIHGFKDEVISPTIYVSITVNNKILECRITDNGVGFLSGAKNKTKSKSSLAIEIVKDRLAILSKQNKQVFSVTIRDLKEEGNQGTEVVLKLPYQYV